MESFRTKLITKSKTTGSKNWLQAVAESFISAPLSFEFIYIDNEKILICSVTLGQNMLS